MKKFISLLTLSFFASCIACLCSCKDEDEMYTSNGYNLEGTTWWLKYTPDNFYNHHLITFENHKATLQLFYQNYSSSTSDLIYSSKIIGPFDVEIINNKIIVGRTYTYIIDKIDDKYHFYYHYETEDGYSGLSPMERVTSVPDIYLQKR